MHAIMAVEQVAGPCGNLMRDEQAGKDAWSDIGLLNMDVSHMHGQSGKNHTVWHAYRQQKTFVDHQYMREEQMWVVGTWYIKTTSTE